MSTSDQTGSRVAGTNQADAWTQDQQAETDGSSAQPVGPGWIPDPTSTPATATASSPTQPAPTDTSAAAGQGQLPDLPDLTDGRSPFGRTRIANVRDDQAESAPAEAAAFATSAPPSPAPAARAAGPATSTSPAPAPAPVSSTPFSADTRPVVHALQAPTVAPRANWGLRGRINSIGLNVPAGKAEQEHLQNETQIRQATWTRPVAVLVANGKGGVGKTPSTVVLAGTLARIRGGFVSAVEFTEAQGTLAQRSEGDPKRGVAEMLINSKNVTSAGILSGYTAPQTSFAHIIGSVQARPEMRGNEVFTARRILDNHYHITVTDTGNNHLSDCYRATVLTADAVLVPVSVTPDGLEGAIRTITQIREYTEGNTRLHERITAVITHTGGDELDEFRRGLSDALAGMVAHVVEVPEDPEIRRGGPITVSRLSALSTRRWTEVTACVVSNLLAAPEAPLV